jgi:hypothetical protein
MFRARARVKARVAPLSNRDRPARPRLPAGPAGGPGPGRGGGEGDGGGGGMVTPDRPVNPEMGHS